LKSEESKLQARIVKALQSHGVFTHSIPNEGSLDKVRTMQLITMGLRPGAPDLIVWWPAPHGVTIGYLEVKARGGRQSDHQKKFEARCHEVGISYDLVWSWEEFEALIDKRVKK
jgi:hypothetical protein